MKNYKFISCYMEVTFIPNHTTNLTCLWCLRQSLDPTICSKYATLPLETSILLNGSPNPTHILILFWAILVPGWSPLMYLIAYSQTVLNFTADSVSMIIVLLLRQQWCNSTFITLLWLYCGYLPVWRYVIGTCCPWDNRSPATPQPIISWDWGISPLPTSRQGDILYFVLVLVCIVVQVVKKVVSFQGAWSINGHSM